MISRRGQMSMPRSRPLPRRHRYRRRGPSATGLGPAGARLAPVRDARRPSRSRGRARRPGEDGLRRQSAPSSSKIDALVGHGTDPRASTPLGAERVPTPRVQRSARRDRPTTPTVGDRKARGVDDGLDLVHAAPRVLDALTPPAADPGGGRDDGGQIDAGGEDRLFPRGLRDEGGGLGATIGLLSMQPVSQAVNARAATWRRGQPACDMLSQRGAVAWPAP